MKKLIRNNHLLTEEDQALISASHEEYRTIVCTPSGPLYIKKDPIEIIKESCLRDSSSYEGRREAVKHMTGFINKVPIPISTSKNIYAFPTSSPSNPNCVWLLYNHIKEIEKVQDEELHRTIVHFHDGSSIPLQASHHVLENQFLRTARCKNLFDPEQ